MIRVIVLLGYMAAASTAEASIKILAVVNSDKSAP
jgi:hypothetical protein